MCVANEVLAANEIGGVKDDDELIEKYRKLSKTRKLSKSQKSAKSRKELSKIGNLPNFNVKENGSNFITSDTGTAFNHLWLAFNQALILQHFDSECHIQIETDVSGYAICGMLN